MKTDAAQCERDAEIWDLRVRGYTLREIGQKVGLTHGAVSKALQRGFERYEYPKVEEARKLMLDQIDKVVASLEKRIDAGDDKAIQNWFRAMERKTKLLGLDVPIKHEVQHQEVTQQDLELQELIKIKRAQNALNDAAHNDAYVVSPPVGRE